MFVYKSDVKISVNNLWIADLDIFREWINNDQQATTTSLSVGIESCFR